MLPINPRDLQRQLKHLKKMGLKIETMQDVERVVIETKNKALIIEAPQVMVMEFGGQKMFYVTGQSVREEAIVTAREIEAPIHAVQISEDDVRFVAEYTNVDAERARRALELAQGDIAKAIELIQSGQV